MRNEHVTEGVPSFEVLFFSFFLFGGKNDKNDKNEIKKQVIYLYDCYPPGLEDYSSRPGVDEQKTHRGGQVVSFVRKVSSFQKRMFFFFFSKKSQQAVKNPKIKPYMFIYLRFYISLYFKGSRMERRV